MAGDMNTLLDSPGTTPAQARDAALTLAEWARDGDELALWLEMCGLAEFKGAAMEGKA